MFLSIIIPHYNIPREMLERCIQSITTQGIPDNEYEIIRSICHAWLERTIERAAVFHAASSILHEQTPKGKRVFTR